VLHSTL